MAKKKGFSPFIATLVLTALCVGALIPSSLAWYSVSTNISVSSSSVLISTADPNYGVFDLQHLYILQPDMGQVDLSQPAEVPVDLFPVSTIDGLEYSTKPHDTAFRFEEGKFRFLAHGTFSEMTEGLRLNFYFDVGVPTVGGIQHPDWIRVHLMVSGGFDFSTNTPTGRTKSPTGWLLTREYPSGIQGMKPNGDLWYISTLVPEPLDASFSINWTTTDNYITYGNLYFMVTVYLEGTKANAPIDHGNFPFSMTVIPSRNPSS